MYPENGGRIGTYFHLFPTYAQAKKVMWDGIDGNGFKVMGHFPDELVRSRNETELQVTLNNGSIYQLIGTDKIDSIVGTNPVGCVFSEYALQNPRAYDLLSPILVENGGWTVFNFTPRGHNHAEGLYKMARNNPAWYCSKYTVDDTRKEDGTPVVSRQQIEAERARLIAQGKSEADADTLIQQEYYCSFEGYLEGAYYSAQLKLAREQGRITRVPWLSGLPVCTFWDLGTSRNHGDSCSIWFAQRLGLQYRFFDYYGNEGEAVGHYAKILRAKPYTYAGHYWPHDGTHKDFGGTGETRRQTGEGLGLRPIHIVRRGDINDGIEAVRRFFSQCFFDERACEKGLSALEAYHKEYDEDRKEFKANPFHDWSSHPSDAFRTMAMSRWEVVRQDDRPRFVAPSAMSV